MTPDSDGTRTVISRYWLGSCGPESPFELPSEQQQTAPDGIGQNQNKPKEKDKSCQSSAKYSKDHS